MSRRVVVVVSDPVDAPELPTERVITADQYLGDAEGADPGATVINLCRSYRYRTKGYYVSLLADARGQQVVPTVETIEGLSEPFGIFRVLRESGVPTVEMMERPRRRSLPSAIAPDDEDGPAPGGQRGPLLRVADESGVRYRPAGDAEMAETLAYFGQSVDPRFQAAAQAVYREWHMPVLRLQSVCEEGEWKLAQVAPVPLPRLSPEERAPLVDALRDERRILRRGAPAPRELKRASIAVLVDEDDPFSPSSPETLERLEKVAARMNVYVHRIGPDEIGKLGEYDALFIRALTGVREPAFQFALRAEALDMPVIDDPQSIIRCSNKVFLEELLRREGIPTPRTRVATSKTPWEQLEELGSPLVVKLPDGSFSAAVHKIASRAEYRQRSAEMFRRSPLIVAQEYLPTEFDWRITVLGGRVLFAARYYMARGHWQIRSDDAAGVRYGRVEAVLREEAPSEVVRLALRAAALIGDGIYGVDIKETTAGPVVIEVNDNPNLDIGYDDAADGRVIYEDIVHFFLRHIEEGGTAEPEERAAPAPRKVPAAKRPPERKHYRPFEVVGMELEYAVVDRDLNAVSLVENAFRVLAGRPTSDVDLGAVGFSNEIADHVFEVKTLAPTRSLHTVEERLVEGVQRFSATLREEFGARLLPTGMHPWMDPARGRLWTRSNAKIYRAYARLFDVQTHGWLNVQAAHLSHPVGREPEAVAMYNASALILPYLPAIAASSPMYEGELQEAVDSRLWWILRHQARIPESQGKLIPEFISSFFDYRKSTLRPMFEALDRLPDASVLRHDFFNARGAVFKSSMKRVEIRVLDVQECVKMDVAIAVFVRSALKHYTRQVLKGRVARPEHEVLVEDFLACIRDGSEARVRAPHLSGAPDGSTHVRDVLRQMLLHARKAVRKDEASYLDLVERVIEAGTLSERIRSELLPFVEDEEGFTEAARRVYIELADCLEANEPWRRRGL